MHESNRMCIFGIFILYFDTTTCHKLSLNDRILKMNEYHEEYNTKQMNEWMRESEKKPNKRTECLSTCYCNLKWFYRQKNWWNSMQTTKIK